MTVAVILDDNHVAKNDNEGKPVVTRVSRTPEELQKLQALVSAAVGLNSERGDQITVENIPFDDPLPGEPVAPSFWQRYGTSILDGARTVSILLLGMAGLFFVVRPMVKRVGGLTAALAIPGGANLAAPNLDRPRTVADLESEIEAQVAAALAGKGEGRRLPVLTKKAAGIAAKEPENTAKLIRSWMADSER